MHWDEVLTRFGKRLGVCPFCKSLDVGLYCGPLPHITCLSCGADGPLSTERRRDDVFERQHRAIDRWNMAS